MAKGGRSSSRSNNGNGGIMGSGIFGHIGTGVVCKAEDGGFYCSLVKFVNVIIMLITLAAIAYFLYAFFNGKDILSGGGEAILKSLRKNRIH
jgi:hypothetical protein